MSLFLTNSGASILITNTGGVPVASGLTTPLADGVHPRLLISPDGYANVPTVSSVKAGIAANDLTEFNLFINYVHTHWDDALDSSSWLRTLHVAFLYLTYGVSGADYHGKLKSDYATKAVSLITSITADVTAALNSFWGTDYLWGGGGYGAPIGLIAIDWMWNELTSEQRQTCATYFENSRTKSNGARCDAWTGFLNRGALQSQGTADRCCHLMLGLLFKGSGYLNETNCDTWIGYHASHLRGPSGVTYINSMAGGFDGIGAAQGLLYDVAYTIREISNAEECYRTANNLSASSHYGVNDTSYLSKYARGILHQIIPDAYPRTADADYPGGYNWMYWKAEKTGAVDWARPNDGGNNQIERWMCWYVAGLLKDVYPNEAALARWLLENRAGGLNAQLGDSRFTVAVPCQFIWWAPNKNAVAAQSPTDLSIPLAQRHARGWWTFRTSWDATIDEPFVDFMADEWIFGRHFWNGQLSIHRKGRLIMNRGGVSGHDINFGKHSPSSLQFPDLTQTPATIAARSGEDNYGVMRHSYLGFNGADGNPSILDHFSANSVYDCRGDYRSLLNQTGYHYALQDLTRSYSSTATGAIDYYDEVSHGGSGARISSYVTQFVYFTPADPDADSVRIVKWDRATVTNASTFGKVYILHVPGTPSGDGSWAAGIGPGASVGRGATGTDGKTFSTDTTVITTTGVGSKLFVSPIGPSSRRIVICGGANTGSGQRYVTSGATDLAVYEGAAGDSHEFEDVYGIQRGGQGFGDPGVALRPYVGESNIEIWSATGSLTDVFVTVLEAADTSASQSTTTAIAGSNFSGARVGGGIAVFASTGITETSGSFTIPSAGTYTLVVAGLSPSTTRTLDPDANGTISGLSAGQASAADSGTSGTRTVTITTTASCVVTVS